LIAKHRQIIASVAEFDQSGPAGQVAPAWRGVNRLNVNFIKFLLRYKKIPLNAEPALMRKIDAADKNR
jgi:hypothetical protein